MNIVFKSGDYVSVPMTEKENNIWVWESLTVKLTNPEGETITLNSLCFNDNGLN